MTNELTIFVGKTEQDRFILATRQAPYLCVEADTEDEGFAKVRKLLDFWHRNRAA